MTDLSGHLDCYLATRRAMGYQLAATGRILAVFVAHLDRLGETTVTVEAAWSWAAPPSVSAGQAAQRLSAIRGFARYLAAFEPGTEIPPIDLLGATANRQTPYLYSAEQVEALMEAAGRLRPQLRAASVQTLIGLMAATGIRTGEAFGLDRGDVDLDAGEITVRVAKGNKTRLLPLHPSVTCALGRYAERRDHLCPAPATGAFLVSSAGTRLGRPHLAKNFAVLRAMAGIETPPARRPPRLYDLRHSFAVNTVLDWHAAGVDIEPRLPVLSTYMGHLRPSATYWYLQAAPELMAVVAARLERSRPGQP